MLFPCPFLLVVTTDLCLEAIKWKKNYAFLCVSKMRDWFMYPEEGLRLQPRKYWRFRKILCTNKVFFKIHEQCKKFKWTKSLNSQPMHSSLNMKRLILMHNMHMCSSMRRAAREERKGWRVIIMSKFRLKPLVQRSCKTKFYNQPSFPVNKK